MNKCITYSIIIPHKNIPELLQRCLDSIPRRDVQIIIVDDNSDADIVDFEHFPGLGDPFVEVVFTKEGKGAGYARNIGLTKAVGKWLLFADADDYFNDGFMKYLDKYQVSEFDLIYFGVYGIDAKTKQENIRGRKYNDLMKDAIEKKEYDKYKYRAYVPWGKLIKRELILDNNIVFDETIKANDMMFSLLTAYNAKNIYFDENKIYTLESRDGSLISIQTIEANFDRFFVHIRMNEFLEKISQTKYKKNIIASMKALINIHNMSYFHKAIKLAKEYKINLFIELKKYLFIKFVQIKKK
jgi:glycosyltransferase involved in cell wall biosynthesis